MYTFMSLKLRTTDLSVIDERIADKVLQAPGFFKDSPVVVDFTDIESEIDNVASFNTADLFDCIRAHQLVPIVASVSDKSSPFASSIALPLLEKGVRQNGQAKKRQSDQEETNATHADSSREGAVSLLSGSPKTGSAESAAKSAAKVNKLTEDAEADDLAPATEVEVIAKAPMFLTRPVRSGQQVFARDTDLIIVGQVGAGAEVLADQNIHVYGPLRGRALCGVSGNANTRIFCQSLEAEMVSVDGVYRVLEDIPADLRGKPAQIWLDNGRLNIEPLVDTNLSGVIA